MTGELGRDLGYAWRTLRRQPLFTAFAVLTLAVGIGANTTVFSVVYATLLRSLPFPDPDRLYRVHITVPPTPQEPGRNDMVWSFPKYRTLVESQRAYQQLGAYAETPFSIRLVDATERVTGELVTGSYLQLLGITPQLGRGFSPEEDRAPDAQTAVILGHALWQRVFGADGSIVGRSVNLDGSPATVVGVMPAWFRGLTGQAELWRNLAASPAAELDQAQSHWLQVFGRLGPGLTDAQALAEMRRVAEALAETYPPPPWRQGAAWGITTRPLDATRIDPVLGRSIIALAVAVALVLLLSCVNLTGLLLARTAARSRDTAVRLAVGARRRDLVRQFLLESSLLAGLGGAAGLGFALLGLSGLRGLRGWLGGALGGAADLTRFGLQAIRLDPWVLGFTVLVTGLAAVLVGLLPVLRATRPDLVSSLKEGSAGAGDPRRTLNLRNGLVVVELALAVVLLVGAGLMLRSLNRLLGVNVGFRPENVLSVRVAMPPAGYQPDSASVFYAQLLDRLAAAQGVEGAAMGNCPPLNGGCNGTVIWFRDRPPVPEGSEPLVGVHHVSPDYFQTLGVPLIRGRSFTAADRRGTPKVVVINQTAAERFWPGEDPIGANIAVGQGGFQDRAEVIGIVGDVLFGTAEDEPQPDVFISYLQAPRASALLYLRSSQSPGLLVPRVRQLVRELDPGLPLYDVRTMEERVRLATVQQRFTGGVLSGFALVSLLLAAAGVYALMAYEVARRTREIGIRLTLGAQPAGILGLVLRRGTHLAMMGLALGLGSAWALTRLIRSLLFEIEPGDPATYAGVSAVLAAAALAACLAPGARAARTRPMEAIRGE